MMKKIIFLAAAMFYAIISFAQDLRADQVPSIVLNTFSKKFPKAMDVEWELKDKLYSVEFEIGHVDHEAWISQSGKVVKHQFDIRHAQLPKEVKARVYTAYKGFRIDDAERIEVPGKVLYKLELKTLTRNEDVFFDHAGMVVDTY